jgi:DNA recombination protein RmuC
MDMLNTVLLIVLIVLVIFVVVFLMLQQQKDSDQDLKVYMQKEYEGLKIQLKDLMHETNEKNTKDLYQFKDIITNQLEQKLKEMNALVEKRLESGFEKSDQTFKGVIERLAKIDEAQKNIEALSKEVVSLNSVLTDKKTRGIFGEVQLYQLLVAVFGEKETLYKKQATLTTGVIADAMIYAPEPMGAVAIDSKFPYDNYNKMINAELHKSDREQAMKLFVGDVKRHIDAIASKYIIEGETSEQAIMFIPAEAIFAEITAHHGSLIEHANNKKVWMASPTTLFSTLTMIQVFVKNLKRDEQIKIIVEELNKLDKEFDRYSDRWDKLSRTLDAVVKDSKAIHTTTGKIKKKFDYIKDAQFEQAHLVDSEQDEEEEEDDRDNS